MKTNDLLGLIAGRHISWQNDDPIGLAFRKGIHVVNSTHIQIQKRGVYFIYTAVSFIFKKDEHIDTFYHKIGKQHPRLPNTGEQILAMSKYGGSNSKDEHYTSFICTIDEMYVNHELSTSVSDLKHLDHRLYANYFGIFRLK